tara:strand:- start:1342 stop:1617 length:276 start_codon:yes stop_codon:yes gene_type:complete
MNMLEEIKDIFEQASMDDKTILYNYVSSLCLKPDNITPDIREQVRKEERNKYMRNRYAEKPELRKKHQQHMRAYRLRKKQELEEMINRSKL